MKGKITAICLAAALTFMLCGCEGKEEKGAKKAVEAAFAALQKADFETLGEYASDAELFGGDTMGLVEDEAALGAAMYGRLGCEITAAELNDDGTVTVTADVTNLDMNKVFDGWFAEMGELVASEEGSGMPKDELMTKSSEMLLSAMEAADDAVTNTVEIKVNKNKDGGWQIETDDALIDAASGGLVSALKDKVN